MKVRSEVWFDVSRPENVDRPPPVISLPVWGHAPDLARQLEPERAMLAECYRCGVRMFKATDGSWKPVKVTQDQCTADAASASSWTLCGKWIRAKRAFVIAARRRTRILSALSLLCLLTGGCASTEPSKRYNSPLQQQAPLSTSIERGRIGNQCLAALGQAQVNFTALPDRTYGLGCSAINTVRLAWLRSDEAHLQLANLGPVTCGLALALEGWARFGVDRAARQILGSPLARIDTFGSYNCRAIAGTDHLSAHATASAVDIAGFVLADGRRISVRSAWFGGKPAEQSFLRIVRTSACRRFSVVLTPDYNSAHRDHFHLETGAKHGVCH